MLNVVTVQNLKKSYSKKLAIDNLSFEIPKNKITAILGPNGAGKSSTINILSTILKKDSGKIVFFGNLDIDKKSDLKNIKRNLGIVPQDLALYEDVPAQKNVEFFASLYGIKGADLVRSVEWALKFVGLYERKTDLPKTFSGGMKRRLNIACAIAHKPPILILDEPTVGIDPQSRNHILNSIRQLKDEGTTVIYTTHYMEEVEEIADKIIIIDAGKKVAEGTLDELLDKYKENRIYRFYLDSILPADVLKRISNIEGIQDIKSTEKYLQVTLKKEQSEFHNLMSLLIDEKVSINHMTTEDGNLEMVFLDLTGKKLRD